jgi:hypothetical protein
MEMINEISSAVLASRERTCAECGKSFIIQTKELYAYKLIKDNRTYWYCCYSHWRKYQKQVEQENNRKRDAYYARMRAKKNLENKRRRERDKQNAKSK